MDEKDNSEIEGRYKPPFVSNDDHVVLILGAGATISEMLSHGAKTQELPPTDANFLKRSRSCVKRLYDEMEVSFNDVWQGTEPRPLKYQQMEMLFSSAFLKVQQTSGNSKKGIASRFLYDKLVELLRETLSTTTSQAMPDQHVKLLDHINSKNPKSLNIISFNYDVLADRALLQGARNKKWDWDHANGYGFQPANLPKREPGNIKLYKLHGSMNWYIPTPGRTRASVYSKSTRIYVPNPATNPKIPAWQRKQKKLGHSGTNVFPLLVPPVFEKGTQIIGELQSVWEQAANALKKATIVYVWGYSLPQTDYHAEFLLAQAARLAKYRLIVCNPDRNALAHVTDVCGHSWNRWYFSINHLFREI